MSVFFTKAFNKIKNIEHTIYLNNKRKRLIHQNPTIISNNCVGGVISHDLGQQFRSPTVNLFFKASDYLKFVSNLHYYLELEVVEIESELPYPVGMLGDIKVFFMHYRSFSEAKGKWDERKKRIDYNNIYLMMTEIEDCNEDIMKQFDELPYKNKVLFTHLNYPKLGCSQYIKGFENESEMGIITDPKPSFWQRRYIDDYDYVSFLNQ
ncbi:MAG: DUF1919 domain-containing protein [Ruminococcus sp.]|uniref:DUF1919 domain-containing protein n=1 Tax=Ruminococcus sp. TaxID=41978 RepID=UPI0028731086|nr:DUF1919 domain-containing protein [Ruminococcus sp.]MBQ3285212.1 DUF1919 domain-containing protein [Ruminococcus sp.]